MARVGEDRWGASHVYRRGSGQSWGELLGCNPRGPRGVSGKWGRTFAENCFKARELVQRSFVLYFLQKSHMRTFEENF